MVLLISGGHCILALVKSVTEFYNLGETLDNSPGEVLDKVARRAKLINLKKFQGLTGGALIEAVALEGDPTAVSFPFKLLPHKKNCNFSFSGLQTAAINHIKKREKGFNKFKSLSLFHKIE